MNWTNFKQAINIFKYFLFMYNDLGFLIEIFSDHAMVHFLSIWYFISSVVKVWFNVYKLYYDFTFYCNTLFNLFCATHVLVTSEKV